LKSYYPSFTTQSLSFFCGNKKNFAAQNDFAMKNESHRYNSFYILVLSFISALGGYLFGFDFAVISGALPFLKDKFHLNEYWEGFATGSLALGAMIGCIAAGKIADKKGRKPGLLLAASVFGISSLFMAFAPSREFFIAARFVAGIGCGHGFHAFPHVHSGNSTSSISGQNGCH
jgi:MFS family permease